MNGPARVMNLQDAFDRGFGLAKAYIDAEIDALAARIAELEAVPQLTDGGTWSAEKVFKPGMVVTFDGSAWACQQVCSNARPGSSDCWRLMIKRGRDAKRDR